MKKNLKNIIGFSISLLLVFALIGCQSSSTPASTTPAPTGSTTAEKYTDDTLKKVLDSGILRIGAEGNYIPFVYNDTSAGGILTGQAVDVANEIARRLGVKTEWSVANKWDGVLAGLQADRYDIVFDACVPKFYESPELSFTIPYTQVEKCLVVAKDNTEITKMEDLKGKICGNALTSASGKVAQKFGAECRACSLAEAMELISQKRVDAQVNTIIAIQNYMKQKPDMPVKIACIYEPEDPSENEVAGILRADSNTLRVAIDKAIQEMIDDGFLKNLAMKYFGEEITKRISLYQ